MDIVDNQRVLVGRDQVLQSLQLTVEAAVAGRGGLTLLAGEPGVGKTRLAEEIGDYARSRGAIVAWGCCWEGEGAPGFWPWLQVLRSLTSRGEGDLLLGELDTADTGLSQLLPEQAATVRQAPGPLAEVGQERFRLFDAIGGVLRAAAKRQPVVAVLDDLHWSDAPSLRLLRFLAQDLRTSPVLILGAYRDVEVGPDHPLGALLGELTWCQHIPLRGLAQHDVARLVAAVSDVRLGKRAAATLRAATAGNPFFIREIAGLLRSEESLSDHRVGDHMPAELTVPGGVSAVINRRVGRLSPSCNRLLDAAAVLGQEFDLCVLSAVLDQSDEMTLTHATEAIRTRLLTMVPGVPARVRFVHALVRQTLYAGLCPARRVELHAGTAAVIERRHRADLGSQLAELAHHLWEAGTESEKAVEYTVEAGHRAMHALAYEEAVNHFTRAVEILERTAPGSAVRRCDLMLLLADAQLATGNTAAARRALKDAALLAQRADAPDRLAHAALAVGTVYTFGVLDNLEIALLQAALKALPDSEPKLRARVLARLAKALAFTPDVEGRTQLSELAVALARRTGDREVLGWVLLDRHVAIWGFAPAPERLDIATKIVQLAKEINDHNLLVRGHVLRMANLLELGDITRYAAEIQILEQLIREHRMTELHWHVPLLRATEAHIAGRLAEAERLAEEGLAMGRRVNHPDIDTWYLVARIIPKFWQGHSEEVEPIARRLIDECPDVPTLRTALALILAETGRRQEAAIELDRQAANRFAGVPRDFTWLVNIAGLAAVCHSVGDRARAEVLYELLLPHAPYLVRVNQIGVGCSGPVAYLLGLLAMTLDRMDEAVRQLEAAITISERIGAPIFAVQARGKLADCLDSRGLPEDRRRVDQLRRQTEAAMRTLGVREIFRPVPAVPPPVGPAAGPIRIFLSWCNKDNALKEALLCDLLPAISMWTDVKIEWWEDSHLTCGEALLPGVLDRLDEADFGLLLLSTRYFGSAFIRKFELPRFVGPCADKRALPVALSPLPEFDAHHDLGDIEPKIVFFTRERRSFAELSGAKRTSFAIDLAASIRRRVLDLNSYRKL